MQPNLFSYIWQHTKRRQIAVILLTLASLPMLYLSLEIPKLIINKALSGGEGTVSLLGVELDPVPYLIALCMGLLLLIVTGGLLKMRINTLKGTIGERLVRRFRYELIGRLLRFPLPHFSRVSQGELSATIIGEAEPLAGYIAESIALPLFQGGTMLTILLFIFMQDWAFGLASVALIPLQAYVIPKIQAQVNRLKKERVSRIRKLSERIGEIVGGAQEIRLHGTERYTLAEFSYWFGGLFHIRLEIFKKKFLMKFLNNTIGHITPFLFYLFGGLLVIRGDLTMGALVAALVAYKDLTAPWKELLNHYQTHEDAKIKYQQMLEQFSPRRLLAEHDHAGLPRPETLRHDFRLDHVSWKSETGELILNAISATFKPGTWNAIVSRNTIGRMRLAQIVTGLEQPVSGTVSIGDTALERIDPQLIRNRLAYQGPVPYIFNTTIRENVFYGLKQKAPTVDASDPQAAATIAEARASGNSTDCFPRNWTDYEMIAVQDEEELKQWYIEGAGAIGVNKILYQKGLMETCDPDKHVALANGILQARRSIRGQLSEQKLNRVVAEFDPDLYNRNATVAENILFGISSDDRLGIHNLAAHPYLHKILLQLELLHQAVEIGAKAALKLAERIKDSTAGQNLLPQFGLADANEVNQLALLAEKQLEDGDQLSQPERHRLLKLFLCLVPERHQFGFITDMMASKLLIARHEFFLNLPDDLKGRITRFDKTRYHPRLSVLDNLLFGRMVAAQPALEKRIAAIIEQTLDQAGVKQDIVMLLLEESQAGINGARLPLVVRHRVTLGRGLIKRPDIMVFHDALSPFDADDKRSLRRGIKNLLPNMTVVWIDRQIDDVLEFDRVLELTDTGALIDRHAPSAGREMPTEGNAAIISQSSVFGILDAKKQLLLTEESHFVTARADEFVYRTGDPGRNAYILVDGKAQSLRTRDGAESVAGNLSAGDHFGLIEIMVQRERILSVRAVTDIKMLRISGEALREIIDSDNQTIQTLLRALTEQWSTVNR